MMSKVGLDPGHYPVIKKLAPGRPKSEQFIRPDLTPLERAIWHLNHFGAPRLTSHLKSLSNEEFMALNHGHRFMKPTVLREYRYQRQQRGL